MKRGGGNRVPGRGRLPEKTGGVDLGCFLGRYGKRGRPRWWEGCSEELATSRRGAGGVLSDPEDADSGTRRPEGAMVAFGSGLGT